MNLADVKTARLQAENDQLHARLRNLTLALREADASLKRLNAIIDEMGVAMQRLTQRLHEDNPS